MAGSHSDGRYGTVDIPEGADQYSDYSVLYMESTASVDFSSIGYGEIKFDSAYGTSAPYLMEGKFVDDHWKLREILQRFILFTRRKWCLGNKNHKNGAA